ncbi:MAG: hypothetical protein JWL77_6937, partial [Chthonomonadaceae bacterium]|nr:hypothetical protein [Chthonomonadaceae bacterium]
MSSATPSCLWSPNRQASRGREVLTARQRPSSDAPALARTGYLGLKLVREWRRGAQDRGVPSWDDSPVVPRCDDSWTSSQFSASQARAPP